jgi:hypothetical protein
VGLKMARKTCLNQSQTKGEVSSKIQNSTVQTTFHCSCDCEDLAVTVVALVVFVAWLPCMSICIDINSFIKQIDRVSRLGFLQ